MYSLIARNRPSHFALTLMAVALIVIAAGTMPRLAVGQDGMGDCPEGYERLPGSKECTPIEWDGPVIDPGLLETPGPDLPAPILILPTPVPTLPDLVTPRADETPPAPTQVPRAYVTITIEGFTCPRWHMPDYTNGLIPPCGPLPGLTVSIVAEGELIAADVTVDSKDSSMPAQVTFFEVPAGKIEVGQKPPPGHESLHVFCGDGVELPLATKTSVVLELQPGKHLTCSFVNVTAK